MIFLTGGVSHLITKMLDTVYPVNSIYISLDSTSPASLYGGTWERFGKGKTLVGVDEADTDFKTAGLPTGETMIFRKDPIMVSFLDGGYFSSDF